MDTLSDILSLLKPQSHYCAGLNAAGPWAFSFPAQEGIKLTIVTQGSCWVISEDLENPVYFDEGDCFLLNSKHSFVVASDPALTPEDSTHIVATAKRGEVAVHNGGGEVFLISGCFIFSGDNAEFLFEALPPIIHVPNTTNQTENLLRLLNWLITEIQNKQPGGNLITHHLAHLMLIQVLRLFLGNSANLPQGWFLALTDRKVGPAIAAIHANPAHPWTLGELAKVAGVSRTVFAQRFKKIVGVTTINYLTRWRMLLAADRLYLSNENVSSIAFSIGYSSESAFSTVFKRIMSCSPTQYRHRLNNS